MRIFVNLFLSLFCLLPSLAQVPVRPRTLTTGDSLDIIRYRVLYNLAFISDREDREFITKDIIRLEIGDKVMKEYSQRLFVADSLAKEAIESGKFPKYVYDIVPPMVIYKGVPAPNRLTVDYRLPDKAPVMTYSEDIPTLEWTILSEKRMVAGYICQRAEADFGGRHWVAWYAQEIPIPAGPYKFGSLPGLILELKDMEGDYHYTCVGLYDLAGKVPMMRWQWNQKKTTKQDLDKVVRQLYANPEQALKALGSKTHFAGDAMLNLPYNPIER